MNRTSFNNLYEEYERQRKEIRDFIEPDENPRTPYSKKEKKNNG